MKSDPAAPPNAFSVTASAATTVDTDTFNRPPDPNLSHPVGGTLAVVFSLGFAISCGLWRKRQIHRRTLRQLQIVAMLEALWRKDIR